MTEFLEKELGTEVGLGRIELGIYNRLILSDIHLLDLDGDSLLVCKKASAQIRLLPLLLQKGIDIRNIELVSPKISVRKKSVKSPYNFQFLADKLSSNDTTKSQTNLRLRSIIVRRATLRHQMPYAATNDSVLQFSNLEINNLSTNLSINILGQDSTNFRIRTLSFTERSGLHIRNLQLSIASNRQRLSLGKFLVELPNGRIECEPTSFRLNNGDPASACGRLRLRNSYLSLSDFHFIKSSVASHDDIFRLQALLNLTEQEISLRHLTIHNEEQTLLADMSAYVNRESLKTKKATGNLTLHEYHSTPSALRRMLRAFVPLTEEQERYIAQIGDIQVRGVASFRNAKLARGEGQLKSDAIQSTFTLSSSGDDTWKAFVNNATIDGTRFDIAHLGKVCLAAEIEKGASGLQGRATFDQLEYRNYSYKHINLEGNLQNERLHYQLNIDDPNLHFAANGNVRQANANFWEFSTQATVNHFAPNALSLSDKYPQTIFMGQLDCDMHGHSIEDLNGFAEVRQFEIASPDTVYRLNRLYTEIRSENSRKALQLKSDFMNASVKGSFRFKELPQCVMGMLSANLPLLFAKENKENPSKSLLSFDIDVSKSDFFEQVFKLPLQINRPATLSGYLDSESGDAFIDGNVPEFVWNGEPYRDFKIHLKEQSDTLHTLVQSIKRMKKSDVKLALENRAYNNRVETSFQWKDLASQKYQGEIKLNSDISAGMSRHPLVTTLIEPAQIMINDSVWNLARSTLYYQDGTFEIQDFKLTHKKQFLVLNGSMTSNANDSIAANLNAINLEYLFNVLNFHPVDFEGFASGVISLNRNEDAIPVVNAHLSVKDFIFNGGLMGDMKLIGGWNNANNRISLDADIMDDTKARTLVNGNVFLKEDSISLLFQSERTNLAFLNSFLADIFHDVEGRATGWCRLFGPLKQLNMIGKQAVDVSATLPMTNTRYSLPHDTILFEPGKISFSDVIISDKKNNKGIVNGTVTHRGFSDFQYSFSIRPENLLIYDYPATPEQAFYGTVYGSGDIALNGRSGILNVDIAVRPEEGTMFTYNTDQLDGVEAFQLLKIKDANSRPSPLADAVAEETADESETSQASDIFLNFTIDVTPDAVFNVILDEKTGDNIRCTGYGPIRATYYNKGHFQMYGTYHVEEGIYKMSMQDIIRKDFQLTPGGSITFSGNPNDGDLNFSAFYTVNSASLSDLNMGNNFSSSPTRVNCILNFEGKVRAPRVSFDLDLPNTNADEKQMIRNLISTEEDMNMQIIYLLSIGRFYTYDYNQASYNTQSQSSVAMQSLLSNTLSTQLNTMLSNVLDNKNWTFGTNFSTGNTGWNDMEVAGILSGRLLNNRLIVNGNFGYRDRPEYSSNFIGDFDIQWLLNKTGNIRLKAYSEINDRYFTKSTLSTQGGGIILRRDFNKFVDLFKKRGSKKRE